MRDERPGRVTDPSVHLAAPLAADPSSAACRPLAHPFSAELARTDLTVTVCSGTNCNGKLRNRDWHGKEANERPALSPLEKSVMRVVWENQPINAEEVRARLKRSRELNVSTVRTLLRRLEAKGYVAHDVDGRTYVYRAAVKPENVAASAVRSIVDKFCSGSIENLLVGLVDDQLISPERLKQLANRIAAAESKQAEADVTGRRAKRE